MGQLTVVSGCMFSGKTRELIRRVNRLVEKDIDVRILKPEIDTRYSSDEIVSHDGSRLPADIVSLDCDPFPMAAEWLALDEAQFFSESAAIKICAALQRGQNIIVAGLDLTSEGEPFGQMPFFLALADEVIKLHAHCSICAGFANRTYRVSKKTGTILVGGAEAYEPRCLRCFGKEEARLLKVLAPKELGNSVEMCLS